MEQIFPKKKRPLKQITLLQAAELMERGKEPFVMFPKDDTFRDYERTTLEEFVEDCVFFIGE